jgi:hypothetical protein
MFEGQWDRLAPPPHPTPPNIDMQVRNLKEALGGSGQVSWIAGSIVLSGRLDLTHGCKGSPTQHNLRVPPKRILRIPHTDDPGHPAAHNCQCPPHDALAPFDAENFPIITKSWANSHAKDLRQRSTRDADNNKHQWGQHGSRRKPPAS